MSNTDSVIEPALKLQMYMPQSVMDRFEEKARGCKPRTTRNILIEWVLTEYAAGNLVHVDQLKGKEAA